MEVVSHSQGQAYTPIQDRSRRISLYDSDIRDPVLRLSVVVSYCSDYGANCVCQIEPTFRHVADTSARFFATVPTDRKPEPSLTFRILIIYECCLDLDVVWHSGCHTMRQTLPAPCFTP